MPRPRVCFLALMLMLSTAAAAALKEGALLQGRIVDWPAGETGVIQLESLVQGDTTTVFATGPIDASGQFQLALPPASQVQPTLAPLSNWLTLRSNEGPECTGEGAVTPPDGGYRFFFLVSHRAGQVFGDVVMRTSAQRFQAVGQGEARLAFFGPSTGRAVKVEGTVTCPDVITVYQGSFTAGWHLLPAQVTGRRDGQTLERVTAAAVPASLSWRQFTEFGGIGVQFEPRAGGAGAAIIGVLPGGPAARAGVRAGDQLVEVDGQSVTGLTFPQIVARVAGTAGVPIRLGLRRGGVEGLVRLTIIRTLQRVP
ncbi:PDZ domain-containing protein [Deinococcus navajonensis]|uniref:PDZ domain-containing protein n=1 Tax=Deinococcus navajonensis TaxID=309884 RepID=A0ABV8XLY3_9DEIO